MFAIDDVNKDENSDVAINKFNRSLKRAELFLLKYITGSLVIDASKYPKPFELQKNTDYIKEFFTFKDMAGNYTLPKDYYMYDNMYKIGAATVEKDCDDNIISKSKNCNTPIELLDRQKFNNRCGSFIKGLKPTIKNPIAKIIENSFAFIPEQIGSVRLEYIRYPKFGVLKTKIDAIYNKNVLDDVNSQNLEWGEWAIEPLIWFLNDRHAQHTRERTAKEFNMPNKEDLLS